jgi:hypothetical protein
MLFSHNKAHQVFCAPFALCVTAPPFSYAFLSLSFSLSLSLSVTAATCGGSSRRRSCRRLCIPLFYKLRAHAQHAHKTLTLVV